MTRIAFMALALALVGFAGSTLRAQDPNYVIWVDAPDSCTQGEQITVRVLMEVRPGASPVVGWRFGLCHDPMLFRRLSSDPGAATQGVCDGEDAEAIQITPGVNGFSEAVLLGGPDSNCELEPGCPYELVVARYVCQQTLDGISELICFCDEIAGVEGDTTATVLVDGPGGLAEVEPTLICGPHDCEDPPQGEDSCDCTGREFWLAFPGNFVPEPDMAKDLRILIASEAGASGRVEVPGIGFVQNFAVAANDTVEVVVPHSAELGRESDVVTDLGVHVISDDNEIQVHALNRVPFSVDGLLALPIGVLGSEYIVLGYKNVYVGAEEALNGSQFAIVSTADGTTINITPTVSTDGHPAGVTYSLALNRGETYQLSNHGDASADLSGTIIESSRPVAVFGSHFCATVPNVDVFFCNHNVEQLPPTEIWGRTFVAMPFATRSDGDTFRMLASADATTVQVNGAAVAVLNRGDVFDYEQVASVPITIAANQPILVAQHARGSLHDGVTDADSSMMLLQPVQQYRDHYLFETPAEGFDNINFANVVAPPGAVGAIALNGVPIAAAAFSAPIGGSGFRGAQVAIATGSPQRFTGPVGFGLQLYGFDEFDAYSMPGCSSYEGRQAESTVVDRNVDDDPCDEEPARVTLTAAGPPGQRVIVVETLPDCAEILDSGAGEVDGHTITFEMTAGQTISYLVDLRQCCDQAAGTAGGVITGEVDNGPCPEPVRGNGRIECCDRSCDTHCEGLDVVANGNEVTVDAAASDDSGDQVIYTFTATLGANTITIGPQADNSAQFTLTPGTWAITVFVSDESDCDPPAADATCTTTVTIQGIGTPPFIRGDVNLDTNADLSDAAFIFNYLFLGGAVPRCLASANVNGSSGVDLSDGVYELNFLFRGGPPPPPPLGECGISEDEEDIELGCEESSCDE